MNNPLLTSPPMSMTIIAVPRVSSSGALLKNSTFPAKPKRCIGGTIDAGDEGALWIVKPSDSSRGRGVYLLRELGELAYDRLSIVQRWSHC